MKEEADRLAKEREESGEAVDEGASAVSPSPRIDSGRMAKTKSPK